MTYEELFEARGREKERAAIALNIYSLGVSKEIILKSTGLYTKEVDNLIKSYTPTEIDG